MFLEWADFCWEKSKTCIPTSKHTKDNTDMKCWQISVSPIYSGHVRKTFVVNFFRLCVCATLFLTFGYSALELYDFALGWQNNTVARPSFGRSNKDKMRVCWTGRFFFHLLWLKNSLHTKIHYMMFFFQFIVCVSSNASLWQQRHATKLLQCFQPQQQKQR